MGFYFTKLEIQTQQAELHDLERSKKYICDFSDTNVRCNTIIIIIIIIIIILLYLITSLILFCILLFE